jgi:hypothetical protein
MISIVMQILDFDLMDRVIVIPFLRSTVWKIPIVMDILVLQIHYTSKNSGSMPPVPHAATIMMLHPKLLTTSPSNTNHTIIADDLLSPFQFCGFTSDFPGPRSSAHEFRPAPAQLYG